MVLLNHAIAWTALSVVSVYNLFSTRDFVHVKIDKGILRGRNATTWRGISYYNFQGIPYAQPPLGELRFKAPREEKSWDGIRDAVIHGNVCPQYDLAFRLLRGEENCLFLNVYTPSLRADRLPVMFYIHGGKFLLSSGNDELWGPDYLVEAGVVLVSINYRLGPLGFLTTGDDAAPGNAGLKDQVAALRWVRRNIAKFGGDPDNVTIFGASTGAACVDYLLLSPMARGLFARAIAHSGSAINTWALTENGPQATIRLAETLGAKNIARDPSRALRFLKSVPFEDIVLAQEKPITEAEKRIRIQFLFAPTVERGVKSEEVFLSDLPLNILKSGNFNQVPYIAGYTAEEGYLDLFDLMKPENMKAAIEYTDRFVPTDIKNRRLRKDLAKSIRKFYFDDKPVGNENISNLVDLYGDINFNAGIRRGIKLQIQSTKSPVYLFVFSYDGGMNLIKFTLGIRRPGAMHGDELGYLFHHRFLFWRTPARGSTDEHVLDTMIRLWTNFAKYGNPTPAGDPLNWKPVTNEKFNFLNISGRDTHLAENPDAERAYFWEKAYENDEALVSSNFNKIL